MEFKVKWIINGELIVTADNKQMAEDKVKNNLKQLVDNNKENFVKLGAAAIQGSASKK